jgi:hypothetical protein
VQAVGKAAVAAKKSPAAAAPFPSLVIKAADPATKLAHSGVEIAALRFVVGIPYPEAH